MRIIYLLPILLVLSGPGPVSAAADKQTLQKGLSQGSFAAKDTTYSSEYGYSVLVPAGYQYSIVDEKAYGGVLSLVAVKDHGNDLKSVFTVLAKQVDPFSFSLEKEIGDICRDLKAENPSCVFGSTVIYDTMDKARSDYRAIVRGYGMHGSIVVLRKGDKVYQLGLISYIYDQAKDDFERIINSFK